MFCQVSWQISRAEGASSLVLSFCLQAAKPCVQEVPPETGTVPSTPQASYQRGRHRLVLPVAAPPRHGLT